MLRYLARRLIAAAVNVFALVLLVFVLLALLPSDPVRVRLGSRYDARAAEALRHEYGLDRPLLVQFADYVARAASGDLGRSLRTGEPVAAGLAARGGRTLALVALSSAYALIFALLGAWAAIHRSRWQRYVGSALYLLSAIPLFVTAGLAVLLGYRVFGISLIAPGVGARDYVYLLLPAALLAVYPSFTLFRVTRDALAQALEAPPAVAQRALGLPEKVVVVRTALRTSGLSLVSVAGNLVPYFLSSVFIVEYTFSLGGLGGWAITAAQNYDFTVVLAVALVTSVVYNGVMMMTALVAPILDPRLASGAAG